MLTPLDGDYLEERQGAHLGPLAWYGVYCPGYLIGLYPNLSHLTVAIQRRIRAAVPSAADAVGPYSHANELNAEASAC